jgi:hypothetical protein
MNIGSQLLRVSRGEIVEPAYLMSLTRELVGKRRAEESRGSGDEEVHTWEGL